jgi:hypothetical protein
MSENLTSRNLYRGSSKSVLCLVVYTERSYVFHVHNGFFINLYFKNYINVKCVKIHNATLV